MLADHPDLLPRQMLGAHIADTLGRAIGNTHAHGGEARVERPFSPAPPVDPAPARSFQHRMRRTRFAVGDVALTWSATACDGEDHRHVGGIDFLLERDANSPGQPPFAQALPEWRGEAIARVGQHTTEAHTGGANPIDLLNGDLRFGPM